MDFMDLLEKAGGQKSLQTMGKGLGLDAGKTSALVKALAPSLMGGLQKQTQSGAGLKSLQAALQSGKHQGYLNNPASMLSQEAASDGNGILGHLFGSKDISRNVAAQAAQETGIDASLIKKALPLLAGLAMGAVSKTKKAESSDGLSGLLGGLLGGGNGKAGVSDLLGMAKKFF